MPINLLALLSNRQNFARLMTSTLNGKRAIYSGDIELALGYCPILEVF
jgi:hypothetical protein